MNTDAGRQPDPANAGALSSATDTASSAVEKDAAAPLGEIAPASSAFERKAAARSRGAGAARAAFEVLAPGSLSLLQDAGRPGFAHLGVTASGAADRAAYAAANRLVGNRAGAAVIEAVFGGLEVRALGTMLVACTGTGGAAVTEFRGPGRHGGQPRLGAARAPHTAEHPAGTSFVVFAGDTIALRTPAAGLRTYLAVRGGFAGELVLGSRSRDILSGLGPAPLGAGDRLGLAGEHEGADGDWPATTLIPPPLPREGPVLLSITRGPRDDWFGDAGWRALLDTPWIVGIDSNRIGLRLSAALSASAAGSAASPAPADEPVSADEPASVAVSHPRPSVRPATTPTISRAPTHPGELPSEGMVVGAVQIPPSGDPVVFLRDHPVTGGYPVIGVLTAAAVDLAAQVRPGDPVRFSRVSRRASPPRRSGIAARP